MEKDNDGGFVYQKLLLIDDHSINANHYMGSTLSSIIIFNLALSNHLMGVDNINTKFLALSNLTDLKTIPNYYNMQ